MNKVQKRERYSKKESPLFRLKNRRKLGSLLGTDISEIERLISKDDNYRVFDIDKGLPSQREIQEPKGKLNYLHKKLFKFLQRIEVPAYLHSGVSGRSYISNAQAHQNSKTLITLDIKSFFRSTKSWHIYRFFNESMECSSDVAGVLAKLCTYSGHVPTGSTLSQAIAYFANSKMLDEINHLAESSDLTLTCYVDDITISGDTASRKFLYNVRGILNSHGMRSHPRKEKIYLSNAPRKVTGSIIHENKLLLPNTKHREIHRSIERILKSPDTSQKLIQLDRLIGKVIAASRADNKFATTLEKLKSERSRLRRELTKINPKDDAFYVYTDGGSRGNPGSSSIGIVIKNKSQETIKEFSAKVSFGTNNEAEYKALIKGLQIAKDVTQGHLICFSDSQVMVNQMNKNYKVKSDSLRKLLSIANNLSRNFESVEFRHVPRNNVGIKRADKILNQAAQGIPTQL